ncbi:MAG: fatty acid desaturase [Acidobacteria bacterium]|nr:fatty acid desaturase [Acidobacteriota bacterium]
MTDLGTSMENHPIPRRLNLFLGALVLLLCAFWIWLTAQVSGWWILLPATAFGLTNNTLFSMLHESVHGNFHPQRSRNDAWGRLFAAFFPTGFAMQRVFHLGHHARNRTEVEQFDYIRPGEKAWLKRAQWYCILTGFYWVFVALGAVLIAIWPGLTRLPMFTQTLSGKQTSAQAMFSGLDRISLWTLRADLIIALSVQTTLLWLTGFNYVAWMACYACFAVFWSSLQYADHAFSPLDVRNGAWNLRIQPLIRWMYLNYHYHRVHHQQPDLSWIHLPKFVGDQTKDPSFLSIYLSMWRGPRPFPEGEHV